MSKRRHRSDFYRARVKTYLANDRRCAEFFGVTTRTVRNWDEKGAPLMAMRLLHLRFGDLSTVHPDWRGFRICENGKLWGPERRHFSAAHLLRWRDWCEEFNDMRRERDAYRRKRETAGAFS